MNNSSMRSANQAMRFCQSKLETFNKKQTRLDEVNWLKVVRVDESYRKSVLKFSNKRREKKW